MSMLKLNNSNWRCERKKKEVINMRIFDIKGANAWYEENKSTILAKQQNERRKAWMEWQKERCR